MEQNTEHASAYLATGRRKTAVARVRLTRGAGAFTVNNADVDTYFPLDRAQGVVRAPLKDTKAIGKFDIQVNVKGGGISAQADAVQLGIARALRKAVEGVEDVLRDKGYLTRDAREVERKKYGRRGARRGFQFSKR